MILMWLAVAPYPLKQFIAITFPENTSPPPLPAKRKTLT